jgi:DNA polymerase III delta prime subunit
MRLAPFNIFVGYSHKELDEQIPKEEFSNLCVFDNYKSIDQIRDLIKEAYCKLYRTIYVLYKAEEMTVQAQNALLKLAEEPPEKCILVLSTDSLQKIIPTLQSRANIVVNKNIASELVGNKKLEELAKKLFDNLSAISAVNVLNVLNYLEKEEHEAFIKTLQTTWFENSAVYRENMTISFHVQSIHPSTNIERHLEHLLLALWDTRNWRAQ